MRQRALRLPSHTGYFTCPDCGNKTVRHVWRPNGEEQYRCIWKNVHSRQSDCQFYAFTLDPIGSDDAANLQRLWNANEFHRDCECGLQPPPAWYEDHPRRDTSEAPPFDPANLPF